MKHKGTIGWDLHDVKLPAKHTPSARGAQEKSEDAVSGSQLRAQNPGCHAPKTPLRGVLEDSPLDISKAIAQG